MKVRMGFVSNSSTSSFCIFGRYFDTFEEVVKAMKIERQEIDGCEHTFDRVIMRFCPECGSAARVMENDEDLSERIIATCESYGLEFMDKSYANYGLYIGWEISGKGQELIDNMNKTNTTVLKLFDKEASFYEGAYAD
jgi:hypothetical protein